jgi:hypothetical protein
MRKTVYIILLCLSAQVLSAAESKSETGNNKSDKLFIGINFGPGAAFRTLHAIEHSYIDNEVLKSDNKLDRPIFGFDAGVNFTYLFSKHVGLETGLQYSMKGFGTKVDSVYFTPNPPPDSIFSVRTTNQYHYMDIPVKIKVFAGKGKVKFIGGAGFLFDFLMGTTNTGTVFSPSGAKTSENTFKAFPASKAYNVFSMSGTASAGIDYKINNLMGLRFEPYFSHEFIRLHKSGTIYHYLWNAGLNIAYYFGVK